MRTRNLDEAIDAVSKVYCPHTVEVVGPVGEVDALLEVAHPTSQPLVSLSYSVPVKIDALNFSRLFLMMHCARGAAATTQAHRSAEWRQGQTMPFSAGLDTKLWFDRAFLQRSVRLDIDKLEAHCARWLGHPLEEIAPFIDWAPIPNFFGFGPGKFDWAVKTFQFLLSDNNDVRCDMDFVAGARPKKVLDFGEFVPDPLYGTAGALQFLTLGLYNAQSFHDFMDLQMSTQHSRVHQALMEGLVQFEELLQAEVRALLAGEVVAEFPVDLGVEFRGQVVQ